jgi:hypothetical protein
MSEKHRARFKAITYFLLGLTCGISLLHYTSPKTVNRLEQVKVKGDNNSFCIDLATALADCKADAKQTRKEAREQNRKDK